MKSAVKKAGNAAKTLGRKLKKTKVGKALKNGAAKLRNLFKRKKDRLRDDKRRQHEQKRQNQDRRRKDEKSKESKEARLQKIVARIRPLLKRTLSRTVSGVALRALLTGMRVWYRLTSLDMKGGEGTRDIWAVLNPGTSAGGAYEPSLRELREIIRDAVQRFFKNGQIASSAQRIQSEEQTYSRNPDVRTDDLQDLPHVDSGADIPAAVMHMQQRGANIPRERMGYTLGEQKMKIIEYHKGADQGKANDRNAFVNGITTYPSIATATEKAHQRLSRQSERLEKRLTKKAERDPEMAELDPETVAALRAMRLGDQTIAGYMRQFLRTGKWPPNVKLNKADKNRMARLVWLMYVRESVRDRENVALAPMVVDLIARGEMTWDEAFSIYEEDAGRTGGRGKYPASMENASRATRGLEAEDAGAALPTSAEEERIRQERARGTLGPLNQSIERYGTEQDRREMENRKVELITRWIEVHVQANGGALGSTRNDIVNYIKRFILEHHGMMG